jgi:hypothetical protein
MLISMPTGTSTIFGVFQAILALLVHRIADRTNSVLTNKLIPFKKFATKIFAGAYVALQNGIHIFVQARH